MDALHLMSLASFGKKTGQNVSLLLCSRYRHNSKVLQMQSHQKLTLSGSVKNITFGIFNSNNSKELCLVVLKIHNYQPFCVGLSHKIPTKYTEVSGCNETKSKK